MERLVRGRVFEKRLEAWDAGRKMKIKRMKIERKVIFLLSGRNSKLVEQSLWRAEFMLTVLCSPAVLMIWETWGIVKNPVKERKQGTLKEATT